jgi:metal-responsive CopG/Arc/MetJ family transcriptional regulator
MMTYMRTIIEVPNEVIESLDRVGRLQKCSRAALIREAIAEYLQQKSLPESDAAFGLWKKRGRDGLAYQESLRSEWDR